MDLMAIARQAWQMTWRHKALWMFGLFVVATGGGGGGGDSGVKDQAGGDATAWLWPIVVAGVVAGLAALWMHVVSEGALIDAARRVRAGEVPRNREELRAGRAAFGRVVRVKLLGFAAMIGLAALLAVPALLAVAEVLPVLTAIAVGVPAAVVVLPLLLTVYVVYAYALRIAVLDGAGAMEALRAAWRFLHGRVLESLQLLVLAALGQAAGVLAVGGAAIPGIAIGVGVWLATGEVVAAAIVGGLLVLPPALAIAGAAGTFHSSVWTMGFLDTREAARP
jgi:hypothetical protein